MPPSTGRSVPPLAEYPCAGRSKATAPSPRFASDGRSMAVRRPSHRKTRASAACCSSTRLPLPISLLVSTMAPQGSPMSWRPHMRSAHNRESLSRGLERNATIELRISGTRGNDYGVDDGGEVTGRGGNDEAVPDGVVIGQPLPKVKDDAERVDDASGRQQDEHANRYGR